MQKQWVFAVMVLVTILAITVQTMRADALASTAPALTRSISPLDMMRNASDLPVERVDNAI
jgi:outer membrane murein-binding lipoprotein Lpp